MGVSGRRGARAGLLKCMIVSGCVGGSRAHLLVPKLGLGMSVAKLGFASLGREAELRGERSQAELGNEKEGAKRSFAASVPKPSLGTRRKARSGASRRAFPSRAWEREGEKGTGDSPTFLA
jgi:hypothetical protein